MGGGDEDQHTRCVADGKDEARHERVGTGAQAHDQVGEDADAMPVLVGDRLPQQH
ncbi:MAG: hypothetical protein M0Z51_13765 [Propionibacterium sp.]|nr:hypothetical protein [Propionibacterium sp.]